MRDETRVNVKPVLINADALKSNTASPVSPRWWTALRAWIRQATCGHHSFVFERFVHSVAGTRCQQLRCLKCGKREKARFDD